MRSRPTRPGSANAPIFVSTDGGATWALSVCLPGGSATSDISLRFGGTTGVLYAAILRQDTTALNILRAASFPPVGLMTLLVSSAGPDQPWVEAAWAGVGGIARDRVYVADNAGTGEVRFSLDAATAAAPAGFGGAVDIEARAGGDRPSVRNAVHRSGVVYGMFVGVRAGGSDIVVVRDDNWGSGGWANLADPGDGLAGRRLVTGVTVPPVGTLLGSVRVSSRLTIAVDPRNRRRVYAAWCDGAVTAASPYRLHLRRSDDGGLNWTADLRTIDNVTNPALAVNVRGTVGLLYQRLTTPAGGNRWETHLEISDDRFRRCVRTCSSPTSPTWAAPSSPRSGTTRTWLRSARTSTGRSAASTSRSRPTSPGASPINATPTGRISGCWATTASRCAPTRSIPSTCTSPMSRPRGLLRAGLDRQPDERRQRRGAVDPSGVLGHERRLEPAWNNARDVPQRPAAQRAGRQRRRQRGRQLGLRPHPASRRRTRGRGDDRERTLPGLEARNRQQLRRRQCRRPDVSFPDPDPTVTFNPADVGPITTTPFHWHLNPVSSTHLCLAVEISTPADPFAGLTLRGRAPGWPDQDLEILDDNNKAQRNMGLSATAARGVESARSRIFALIHNAATFRRDIQLAYTLDPVLSRRVPIVNLEVLGQRRVQAKPRAG